MSRREWWGAVLIMLGLQLQVWQTSRLQEQLHEGYVKLFINLDSRIRQLNDRLMELETDCETGEVGYPRPVGEIDKP